MQIEDIAIEQLKDHPKNYKQHPDDQIEHLCQSIREHGVCRNVVIANDCTILAGHAVVKACRRLNLKTVPVMRLDCDPLDIKAIKLLTADNEIAHLADVDDRALTELLKEILDTDNLFGTGYDEQMLASLLLVTRPASEVADPNEAAEWVGMPEYQPVDDPLQLLVRFRSEDDRAEFARQLDITLSDKVKTIWFPPKERDDVSSLRIEA